MLGVTLWLVALVTGLAAAVFAWAQTEGGRHRLARLAEARLAEAGTPAEIEGLAGLLPFDMRVGRIRLADEGGTWLEAEAVRLALDPLALLGGTLRITELSAERLALARPPAGGSGTGAGAAFDPRAWTLPERLPTVSVERLRVARLELPDARAGGGAVLRLEGRWSVDDGGRKGEGALDAVRLDREGTSARLAAILDLAGRRIDLAADLDDATGLVGAWLGRPGVARVRFHLEVRGPPEDLRGRLVLDAPGLAEARATLTLALGTTPALALEGRLEPAPEALPPALRGPLGAPLALAVDLRGLGPGRFRLARLSLESAVARAEGAGELDATAGRIAGRVTVAVPDLAALSPLSGRALGGALDLVLEGGGENRAVLTVTGRDLHFDALTAARLDGRFDLGLVAAQGRFAALDVTGGLAARALALAGRSLAPDPDLDLDVRIRVPVRGDVDVEKFVLTGRGLRLELAGGLARDLAGGRLRLRAVLSDLAALGGVLDVPEGAVLSAGSAELAGELRAAAGWRRLEVPFRLTLTDPVPADPRLAAVLGPAPRLAAVVRREGTRLGLEDLDLALAVGRVRGTLALDGEDDALSGRLRITVPDPAPLAPLLGVSLAGTLEGELRVAGSLARPELRLTAGGETLAIGGFPLARARLEATLGREDAGITGRLALELDRGGAPLHLTAGGRLAGPRLSLRDLALEGPGGLRGRGTFAWDLAAGTGAGRLALAVADLAALRPWHAQDLGGGGELEFVLTEAEGRPRVGLEAAFAELVRGDLRVGQLTLQATVDEPFLRPMAEVRIGLVGLARPGLAVATAALDLTGPPDRLAWRMEAEGHAREPFALTATGTLAPRPPALELTVAELAGRWGTRPLRLRRPLVAHLERGILEIPEIDVELGEADVRGGLLVAPDRTFARLEARGPLALFAALGGPPLAGTLRLEARLDGPRDAPRGTLRLRVSGLRPTDPLLADLPSADLALDAGLEGDVLRLDGLFTERDGGRARLVGRLPLRFDPAGLPQLAADGALRLEAEANARLALLTALLGRDDVVAEGRAVLRLRVDGSPAAPRLSGTLRLVEGRLEEARSGLLLTDLRLDATASDGTLTVRELAARDGGDGRLRLAGTADVTTGGYRFDLEARDFRLFDNALGRAVVDADLRLVGDGGTLAVTGDVEVGRAVFDLSRLEGGATIPDLPVLERTRDGRLLGPRSEVTPAAGRRSFRLVHDIRVRAPGRVFVRGRGLESEWRGELVVTGSPPRVALTGALTLVRGHLDFLGRRLRLEAGELRFLGALPPEPELRVRAVAEAEGVRAVVAVTGPLRAPEVTLASEPVLPPDEILARLLFGRARGELTPVQGLRLAAALERLRGGGLDPVGGVRDILGLDVLEVGGEDPGTATLTAGKYVADDVYLEVRQSLATGETGARVEVELGPRLDLGAETGPAGSGVELEWRYDY